MKEASYYVALKDQKVRCELCPHNCIIKEGKLGICGVRKNTSGKLYSLNYGVVTGLGFDPIEKKPLYHYYPGRNILSLGSLGCNMKCFFCQNWQISQVNEGDLPRNPTHQPQDIVQMATNRSDNLGVAYTYNEPAIYYEFMLDIARAIKKQGLKNVMVTNGYIHQKPLAELLPYMDAFSVDLKGFTEEFYRKHTASGLQPIVEAIEQISRSGAFMELTNLVIPGLNDQIGKYEEMLSWIRDHIGEKTVLHISRYYPSYKSSIGPTSVSKLKELYTLATQYLDYVYLGNVMLEAGSNTYCDGCGQLLVKRNGYYTRTPGLDESGSCTQCGNKVFIR